MADQPHIEPRHIVAASALVTNPAGDILMVRTHKRGWEIPGGQVELGETLIEAVIRETQEEAGVTITVDKLGTVQSNLTRGLVVYGFLAQYHSGSLTPSDETPEVEWVGRGAVLERITHPAILARVDLLLNYAGRVAYHAYYLEPYRTVLHQYV